ncbi:MAG: cadherin-like domain-containing protein [Rhodanobacteraceae bacterium]|nr:cadherin-like domain-containing protein [Xanthomonadales bacterium]MCP5478819.1 cadherin-like domain-containing protein [Rhodanobacteraceae bacterium]HPF73423.1 Ig-like domain-containing protein [Xanthomonadaceae bacterium]HRX99818.1 Ig-like domain-containing protein [Xanthomonadaceae bacterium]
MTANVSDTVQHRCPARERQASRPLAALLAIMAALLASLAITPAVAQVHWVEDLIYPQDPAMLHGQANAKISVPIYSCDHIASSDGRYVVFDSVASNLVDGDNNLVNDVFVRDTVANATARVSLDQLGNELGAASDDACISGDGRYVVYRSSANPTGEVEHSGSDVFLYDRQTDTQRSISKPRVPCSPCSGYAHSPTISADGSTVVFVAVSNYLTAEIAAIPLPQIYAYSVADGTVKLISKASSGDPGNGVSSAPSVSDTGRYVAFGSSSTDFLSGFTTNGVPEVYVHDDIANTITRIGLDENGVEPTDDNGDPQISGDGSHVSFIAYSPLVAADTNSKSDVYVYRMADGTLELGSQSTGGALNDDYIFPNPILSQNGRKMTFTSNSGALAGLAGSIMTSVFVRDLTAGTTTRIAPDLAKPGRAYYSWISPDGEQLYYLSSASEAAPGDNNGQVDLFRTDLATLATERISKPNAGVRVASGGNDDSPAYPSQQRNISNDGRYVVFVSEASNIDPSETPLPQAEVGHIYLLDRKTGQATRVSHPYPGAPDLQSVLWSDNPSLSADGRYVAYGSYRSDIVPNDTNDRKDIFIWDRLSGTNQRITVNAFGTEANDASSDPAISADGRHVVFISDATNLTTDLLSSNANVFHVDLDTGDIELISRDSIGNSADSDSNSPGISADGRKVVFDSWATNLVANDTNGQRDVFLHDRQTHITTRVSVSTAGDEGDDDSYGPSISDDGSTILFGTNADNLGDSLSDDTNDCDYMVHTPATAITEVVGKNSSNVEQAGNDYCYGTYSRISADGRYVMFTSYAGNLAQAGDAADTNNGIDAFVRDRVTGSTRRVSQDSTNTESKNQGIGIGMSADGRYVIVNAYDSNWKLEAGYVSLGQDRIASQLYLMERDGMVEPSTTDVNPSSLLGAEVGVATTMNFRVVGDASTPADGQIVVQASTGETCRDDNVLPLASPPNAIRFDCTMNFDSVGARELRVSYMLSATHESSAVTTSIDVAPRSGNNAPVADSQSVDVDQDSSVSITLTASDADGDPLTYLPGTAPAHGTVSGSPPNLIYTPDAGYTGADSFTFKVSDGTDQSALATVSITVNAVLSDTVFTDGFEQP